jgi:hypothetical protein
MMRRTVLLFGMALGAAGCASTAGVYNTFYKADMTAGQLSRDRDACESGAQKTVLNSGGGDAWAIFNECMASKGYTYGKAA